MPNEDKRDLAADLALETKRDLLRDKSICEVATVGPWVWNEQKDRIENAEGSVAHGTYNGDLFVWEHDATFIAEARTGWPHAIERALAAEKRLAEICDTNAYYIDKADRAEADTFYAYEDIRKLRRENAALRRLLPVTNEQAAEQLRLEREERRHERK